MNIKEQESQLSLTLKFEIWMTLLAWMLFWGFIGFRLWSLQTLPEAPLTIGVNAPTVNQTNLDVLRNSIKSVPQSNLPVVRVEPFD